MNANFFHLDSVLFGLVFSQILGLLADFLAH